MQDAITQLSTAVEAVQAQVNDLESRLSAANSTDPLREAVENQLKSEGWTAPAAASQQELSAGNDQQNQ